MRGQVPGVRLGAGVAIAAFEPWRVCKMESRWPASHNAVKTAHRMLSALITNGSKSMVVHAVYCDPQHEDGLDQAIL